MVFITVNNELLPPDKVNGIIIFYENYVQYTFTYFFFRAILFRSYTLLLTLIKFLRTFFEPIFERPSVGSAITSSASLYRFCLYTTPIQTIQHT